MPVEVTCDKCGADIIGRYGSDSLYCEGCISELESNILNLESQIKNLQDELDEEREYITEVESLLNDKAAEAERLARVCDLNGIKY